MDSGIPLSAGISLIQYMVSYVVVRMDSLQLKRRRIQQAYEDAEVNEEFEQEAVAPDEIAVPEETDIIDRNEGATTSLESNFKESVAKRILSEAAAKLAKAKEGLATHLFHLFFTYGRISVESGSNSKFFLPFLYFSKTSSEHLVLHSRCRVSFIFFFSHRDGRTFH